MTTVRIDQPNAHLATNVRLEFVDTSQGQKAKASFVAISNDRRGGDGDADEPTSIKWTLWGKQAEDAHQYLCKGSHVNISGRLNNNNYEQQDGTAVYAWNFTAQQLDYLDTKAEGEALRARRKAEAQAKAGAGAGGTKATSGTTTGHDELDDDIPF